MVVHSYGLYTGCELYHKSTILIKKLNINCFGTGSSVSVIGLIWLTGISVSLTAIIATLVASIAF